MISKRRVFLTSTLALTLGLAACGPSEPPTAEVPDAQAPAGGGDVVAISGAGATFPAPLFQRWFDEYNRNVDSSVQVSYQSVGSGAGLEQYINGTVDFGASEAPIEGDRLQSFEAAYPYDPLQIPVVGGIVVLAHSIPDVGDGELVLTRDSYCGIVQGDITNWSDPTLAAANPDLDLPDLPITWVHRSDGSGTTFVFTNHLDTVCPNWAAGAGTSVDWPVGIGGQGNEGVSAAIEQNEGAIGYTVYSYATLNEIPMAQVENAAGNIIEATPEAGALAFEGEEIPDDFALLVPDPQGEEAYPIAGLVWVMIYREYSDANQWQALREVMEWSLGDEGQRITSELGYVPMPPGVVERIQAEFDQIQAG